MRPSLVVSLLLLSFLLHHHHQVKGIRLEKGFMQVDKIKVQDKEEKSSLIQTNNGGTGDVSICKEGHCTGMNRKLTTVTISTSTSTTSTTTSKNEENEGNKANPTMNNGRSSSSNGKVVNVEHEKFTMNSSPNAEHQEVTHDNNIVDIMDYSPAKRKPPIHN